MAELLLLLIDKWRRLSSSSSSASGLAAVVETCVGMSRRPAVQGKMFVSMCSGVGIDTMCSGSVRAGVVGVGEVRGHALLLGLPSKITMVMMTFSAFLVEKHVAEVLWSF